jgi:hypothetical protein
MREAYILCIVGRQGGGKTFRQVLECLAYAKKRKVLVFDCNVASGSYKDFSTIDYDCSLQDDYKHGKVVSDKSSKRTEVIRTWPEGVGARRVVNYNKQSRDMMSIVEMNSTCLDLMQHFRDGMLVMEDTNAYLTGVRQNAFLSSFVRCRHKNTDLVLIFQSAGAMDPRIWANTSLMRMHKTLDSVRTPSIRRRIPGDKFEMVMLAELIVNQQYDNGNIYFFVYLEFRKYKILGVNASMMDIACSKYLNVFSGELKSYMAENEIKDRSQAIKSWTEMCKKRYLDAPQ